MAGGVGPGSTVGAGSVGSGEAGVGVGPGAEGSGDTPEAAGSLLGSGPGLWDGSPGVTDGLVLDPPGADGAVGAVGVGWAVAHEVTMSATAVAILRARRRKVTVTWILQE